MSPKGHHYKNVAEAYEVPEATKNKFRPVGNGLIRTLWLDLSSKPFSPIGPSQTLFTRMRTIFSHRGRGNELPDYVHSVPTGPTR